MSSKRPAGKDPTHEELRELEADVERMEHELTEHKAQLDDIGRRLERLEKAGGALAERRQDEANEVKRELQWIHEQAERVLAEIEADRGEPIPMSGRRTFRSMVRSHLLYGRVTVEEIAVRFDMVPAYLERVIAGQPEIGAEGAGEETQDDE